jgi:hypothetical protein
MTPELENFYAERQKELDEAFSEFCFYDSRFESRRDAELYFNNERNFWEFVENTMERNRSWG